MCQIVPDTLPSTTSTSYWKNEALLILRCACCIAWPVSEGRVLQKDMRTGIECSSQNPQAER